MDKVIVISNPDGSCSIFHPAPEMFDENSRTRLELAKRGVVLNTEGSIWGYLITSLNLGSNYRVTNASNLPTDRFFRDAWTDDNATDTVDIDINKAIEIKKDQLRELRQPLLKQLDVDMMRALENSNTDEIEDIKNKKQELRDVTSLELPVDIEELKSFIPDCLKEN